MAQKAQNTIILILRTLLVLSYFSVSSFFFSKASWSIPEAYIIATLISHLQLYHYKWEYKQQRSNCINISLLFLFIIQCKCTIFVAFLERKVGKKSVFIRLIIIFVSRKEHVNRGKQTVN